MKAQYVYENISFERGKDPKESLGIGSVEQVAKIIKDLSKDWGRVSQSNLDPRWELAGWVNPYTSGRTWYLSVTDEKGLKHFPRKYRPKEEDSKGLYMYYDLGTSRIGISTLDRFLQTPHSYL